MSTRGLVCIVNAKIRKNKPSIKELEDKSIVILYNHCDSYPEGLGSEIEELIHTNGFINRLNDTSYLTASILSWIMDRNQSEMKQVNDYTGSGIETEINLDMGIEYLYVINLCEKNVRCYSVDNNNFDLMYKLRELSRDNKDLFESIDYNTFYSLKCIKQYEFGTELNKDIKYFSVCDLRYKVEGI